MSGHNVHFYAGLIKVTRNYHLILPLIYSSFTFSRANHLMYEINASDALCDWVFHLQTCVHLQEIEILLGIHQKLYSTCSKYYSNIHFFILSSTCKNSAKMFISLYSTLIISPANCQEI